jgi:DNA-binding transcriptional ArsR family regulator
MFAMAVETPEKVEAAGLEHPEREEIELGAVLHALSDPVRLSMVAFIAADEAGLAPSCSSFDVSVSKSTCTHHFKILREAGVIRQVKQGTRKISTLRREDLDARFPGLLDSVLAAAPAPPA